MERHTHSQFENTELSGRDTQEGGLEGNTIETMLQEKPEEFVSWFEEFKNSIGSWPKRFFENRAIKNALVYASIPFAFLAANPFEGKAEELAHHETTIAVSRAEPETETEAMLRARYVTPDDFLLEDTLRAPFALRVNRELTALASLEETFETAAIERQDRGSLGASDDVETQNKFSFSENLSKRIIEGSAAIRNMASISNAEERSHALSLRTKKIFDQGSLRVKELLKVMPEVFLAFKATVGIHELGHRDEALRQGADDANVKLGVIKGSSSYRGEVKHEAAVDAAGINAERQFSEFLVNQLREEDSPSQLLALFALMAKSSGVRYVAKTELGISALGNNSGNDLMNYAKETGVPLGELMIGLTADYLADPDTWRLLRVVLGEEGVRIPESTLSLFYELGEEGPRAGIKLKGVF